MARRHPEGSSSSKIVVAVTPAEHEAWKRAARYLRVTVSDLVRQSVAQYLRSRIEAETEAARRARASKTRQQEPVVDPLANTGRFEIEDYDELRAEAAARNLDPHAPPTDHDSVTMVAPRPKR